MEINRSINGREYSITVDLEHFNAPEKRWVAYCNGVDIPEEVGSNPTEAVRKLEMKILNLAS